MPLLISNQLVNTQVNDKKENTICKEGTLGQQGYILHELGNIQQLYTEEKENTFAADV